ncbi:MAG: potassium transporter KefA [Oscillospiraceae bacterium]|nr:MAG: potassium transporter KefA [Oscillospiraceae bacterium]
MNYRVISYILGWVLAIEGLFLAVSAAVGGMYGERAALSFLYAALICAALGMPAILKKPRRMAFFMKEGFVTVALCWIVLSIFGALPFVFSGEIPRFTDALFETVSGFTTTGASVVPDVEVLSHCTLFWRSFTHWIGGMGVLVFLLAILPLAGGSQMYLMQAESPGPSVGKLVPKTRHTALILYALYILLSIVEFILLLGGGMTVFNAVTTTFGTAGTGGFGIRNSSMADFSPYVQWVVAVFMMLFGINFNLYFLVLIGRGRQALKSEELRTYLGVIAAATLLIVLNTRAAGVRLGETVRHAFFQVSSIITTTGFATCDFDLWPSLSKCVLVLLMLVGACAGSTGGGIKISRVLILIKRAGEELHKFIFPNSVTKIRLEKKILDREVVHTTSAFLIVYVFIFAISTLLVSAEGHDLETCFTAVAATFNNIGPGLSVVGPTRNFGFFSDFTKYVLIFDMLAGRLELFPMLILFSPRTWLKNPPLFRKHS